MLCGCLVKAVRSNLYEHSLRSHRTSLVLMVVVVAVVFIGQCFPVNQLTLLKFEGDKVC